MIVISRTSNGPRIRLAAGTPAPPGATLASFVLFAALACLLAMLYAFGEWFSAGGFGFPSDAAWTRLVFAQNIASGKGLSFNPGVPVAGAAGPAWVALLGLGGLVLVSHVFAAKLLGVICLILTAYLVWAITLELLEDWRFAFLAAVATVASPRLVPAALGGTEGALAALLLAAVLHWQARSWRGGKGLRRAVAAFAGLAALCRPELLLLLPLMLVDRGVTAAVKADPGRRLQTALRSGLPEVLGATLVLVPYLIYNWRVGGPLWQQPEAALHAQPLLAWPKALLGQLWHSNPVLACAALVGLPVAVLAAAGEVSFHPSFLVGLIPLTVVVAPGLLWPNASLANATYAAAYLSPLTAILGSAGLFLIHRQAKALVLGWRNRVGRIVLAVGIVASVGALGLFAWLSHSAAWRQHGVAVKKVSGLQVYIGRWAFQHLAPDASIASREVGAIGFYSRRRMVDLGGAIDSAGMEALRRPGSPDTNLLAYLLLTKPSHLAIRPADFPDLSQRTDLFKPATTCMVTDPVSGGVATMVLYETPWPAPSLRALEHHQ